LRHGIEVKTASKNDAAEYASTVSLNAGGIEASCTLAGAAQTPRIVSLLGYTMEVVPSANSLIMEYDDSPGMIGAIGTVLGKEKINITTMQVGFNPKERHALIFMNVEGDVNEGVLDKLRSALELKNLWSIKL